MIEIRQAVFSDFESIHKLSHVLVYQPELARLKENLSLVLAHPDYEVVVITENQNVVGWMNLCVRHRIEAESFFQIMAVVVDKEKRGLGLGKKLLNYAESQAKKKNFNFIGLSSGKHRTETHKFYISQGYTREKESYFFSKDI